MGKILVLAEKPSVGRELARVLGCRSQANGYLSGSRYIVTWALGHLVELAAPEHYNKQYKTWSMDQLPMLPKKMELSVIPQTAKQYGVVKSLLHSKEVSSLIIATDAGREGELVARWIIEKAGYHKPIQRLWISSQTDKAIRQGFSSLRDGKDYLNLYQSAQARAEADWIVGLNVTRALTCKFNAQLSAGRVQTPTLALIVERENAIRKFVPRDFWTVNADLGSFFVTYKDSKNQSSIFDRAKAEAIAQKIKGRDFTVLKVNKTEKRTPPPALYDLTELQRDANKLYGFSAKQTLSYMQSLYERHKALTYPRTDSRYLTEDIVPTLPERVKAVMTGEFAPAAAEILKTRKTIARSCINNAKVSDHHAIIPTEEAIELSVLSSEERKIYSLVVKRFLTCFYPPYEYRKIQAELFCEGERFTAVGRETLQKGWKKVYDIEEETEETEQNLPVLSPSSVFRCKSVQLKASKTTPPARYTEATLLCAMENPSSWIEDKKMKEFISGGLGTPATRADIIEKLFSSFYIERSGKSIVPTSKGFQLIQLVPSDLKEPLLTAKWEQKLDAISKGSENKTAFIHQIEDYTRDLIRTVKTSDESFVHDNITRTPCPVCGKFMLEVNGKRGKMLVCQDRECGHRQTISVHTRARCPNCHKFLELYGEGENKTFVCPCGYREKESAFQKRMQSQKSGASKQDVKKYLNQQKKEQKEEKTAMQLAFEEAMRKRQK